MGLGLIKKVIAVAHLVMWWTLSSEVRVQSKTFKWSLANTPKTYSIHSFFLDFSHFFLTFFLKKSAYSWGVKTMSCGIKCWCFVRRSGWIAVSLGLFHLLKTLSIPSFFGLKVVAETKSIQTFAISRSAAGQLFFCKIRKEKIGQTNQIKCHSMSKVLIPFFS